MALRRVISLLFAFALFGAGSAAASTLQAQGATGTTTCTAAQKASRQHALAAYKKRMARDRAAYFKRHHSAKLRRQFVRRQEAKLRALKRAASCTVNQAPTAVITPPGSAATIGDALAFDGSKSSDSDGTIAAYTWNFGDGSTAQGATTSHVFTSAGSYVVTLTVTDNQGSTGTASVTITAAYSNTTVFDFHIGPGVPDADTAAIESGAAASGHMLDSLGHALTPTPIYVESNAQALAADYVSLYGGSVDDALVWIQTTSAFAGLHAVFLNVGHPDWQLVPQDERGISVAHETFHIFQNEQFSGPLGSAGGADGSKWLHEGAAEWWGCYSAGAHGVDTRRDNYARIVRDNPSLTLADLESQSAPNQAYGFGFIAVDRLVALKGVQALFDFWRIAGSGTPWQSAFQEAFGMSLESFYADFQQYRQTL